MVSNKKTTQTKYIIDKTTERIVITCVGLILFMEMLDGSALNTSLPQIAFSLRVNPLELKSAMTIYLLAVGACIPAAGWFVDRFGANRVLGLALAGFLLSSLGCGFSDNVIELTTFRALQGVSGAFLTPVARLSALRFFRHKMAEVTAKIAAIMLLGLMIGPIVGGFITTFISWRFIFFINVPVGILLIYAIAKKFPKQEQVIKRPFDTVGFGIISLALLSLLAGLDTLTISSVDNFWKTGLFLTSLLLFSLYLIHYRRLSRKQIVSQPKSPVIDLSVFNNKTYAFFTALLFTFLLFYMSNGFISTLYIQTLYGYTALQSGFVLFPMIIGTMISRQLVKLFAERFSVIYRLKVLLLACVFIEILLSLQMLYFNLFIFIGILFINGMLIGMIIPSIQQTIYTELSDTQLTNGSVINSTIQQIGNSFSVTVAALILLTSASGHPLNWDTPLPKHSYAITFWINSVCMLLAWLSLWKAPKTHTAGQSKAVHKEKPA